MILIPKLRLFYKFALVMILLATTPLAIVSWQIYNINQKGMQSAILELHTNIVTSLANRITSYIEQIDRQIQFVIKTLNTQGRESVYQSFLDSNPDYISITIINDKGMERLKAYNPNFIKEPKLLDLSENSTFRNFLKNKKKSSISPVYFINYNPCMEIIYPIEQNPSFAVMITISLGTLWSEVEGMKLGKTGYTFLVDDTGLIICHPDKQLAINHKNIENVPFVDEKEFKEKAKLNTKFVGSREYINESNESIIGTYAPVTGLPWRVITEQKKKEAYLSVYQMRNRAILLTIISILAGSIIAFFFARALTRPILQLINVAKRVSEGDFNVKVELGKTRDEMLDLAETFNLMTGRLKEYSDMQVDKIIAEKTKTEAIIFSIDDGLIMTDYDGRIQLINSQAKTILNITDVEFSFFENKSIIDIISNEELKKQIQEVFAHPTKEFFKEIVISTDYNTLYFKTNANRVRSLKGEELGVVTVFHNITLEKELDEMKDNFLHSITHDLRNPMTSIRGFVRFLLDGIGGPINEQQKKMLQTVDRSSARLLGMINDILDIAKIESKKFEIELSDLDLKDMAMRSREMYQPQIEKKSMEFIIDFPEQPAVIKADARLTERVFQNLIGNAVKFLPTTGGKIIVACELSENNAIISVIDNGPGIPKDYLDKIFDKFQQVQGQKKGGTGLGLTICKFIVEAHLGKIWVESEIGKGAQFKVQLPLNLKKTEAGQIIT